VTEFHGQYFAVAVFVLAAFPMVGAMLGMSQLLRPHNPQDEKYICYDVYALLFVVFDVEAVFIFPSAVDAEGVSWFALGEIAVFVAVLLLGFAYVWRKGLLTWA
jgi:NADH-quinone oxidoreductase subunit A